MTSRKRNVGASDREQAAADFEALVSAALKVDPKGLSGKNKNVKPPITSKRKGSG